MRDTAIDKRWIWSDSESSMLHSVWAVAEGKQWPWNVVWFVFLSWVISYANEGEILPTIGEPPTPGSFDNALELSWHGCIYHLACRLRIRV